MYRILTEDKNRGYIVECVTKYFDAFTVVPAIGYWRGLRERSVAIDIEAGADRRKQVDAIAREIARGNKQEAVLVQEIETQSHLVASFLEPIVAA